MRDLIDALGATVGKRVGPFQPAPKIFDGVQLRCVRWKIFLMQRVPIGQILLDATAAVCGQPIPDQYDVAMQLLPHRSQECQHVVLFNRLPGIELHQQVQPMSSGRNGNSAGCRHVLMTACAWRNRGSLTHGRPTPLQQRTHEKADFVEEYEVGVESRSFFLIRSQSRAIHPAIASSSRWLDRTRGFCGLKPSDRKRRGMWSTWYSTPYCSTISCRIRGQVHRSVEKPCDREPFKRRLRRPSRCRLVNRHGAPGWGWAANACSPRTRYACTQRSILRREAPTRLAAFAGEICSSTTIRTARRRRASNCSALPCVLMTQHIHHPKENRQ